jgi:hypothetical protein
MPTPNPFFADATTVAMLQALTTLLNSGKLELYNGSQPAGANTAVSTQTLLAVLTLNATAFGTPTPSGSDGSKIVTATAGSITSDSSADATGTATWFRAYESDGTTVVMDGDVGVTGGSQSLLLNTTSIVAGGVVAVTAFTIAQAE